MKKLLLLIGLFISIQTLKSQISYTWNGTASTAWNNPANWTPNGIPATTDHIKIVTGSNNCLLNANTGVSNITVTSGTLDLGGFTLIAGGTSAIFTSGTVQNGSLVVSSATTTTFGNGPMSMNCVVNVTSAAVTLKNTTFQQTTIITKTGASNDGSTGNNIFNGAVTFNNAGGGFLMLGNGNPDQFNAAAAFNNTGTNHIYVAYSSTNNIFRGITIFNNTPTANAGIYVGQNSAGTLFNDNIIVSSSNGLGVLFGGGATASSTLSASKSISIGAGGFSAGTLSLRQFTQTGATPQNLALTGTANLTFGPSSSFGGDITASSPTLFLNGSIFNGASDFAKTGTTGDYSVGGNTFNGVCSITNSGSSFFLLGNSNPDKWNSDVIFTDNGSERLLPCWASAGNQFNGNIYVNTSGTAVGIQFCGGNATATATLAATKTIQPGTVGLNAGYLYLRQFTQLGNAPVVLTASGSSALYLGPASNFGGAVTATAPDVWAQGATYNSPAEFTKTGGGYNHNNQYQNIFNSTCTINQQSNTGYFMLGYNSNDLFRDDITVTSTGSGGIYLGWNSGTGTPTLSTGKTISVGSAGFTAGALTLNTFTQLGNADINLNFTGTNTPLIFARGCVIGGNLNTNTSDIYFSNSTFNGSVNATKTGAGNNASSGGNIFQGNADIYNTGAGNLLFGNGVPDTWNGDVSFTSSGASYIGLAWNSAGNIFNGNITVSSTGSSTGIQFCSYVLSTATLAAGKTLQTGAPGFSSGTLLLKQFTQLGNAAMSLNLTGATTLIQVGPFTTLGGDFTVISPRILLNGATYAGEVNLTKTGNTGEWSTGGNTFNSTTTINQAGGGYFGFANGAPDIYNGDLYANNNSTDRIIFGNSPVGNQFNGNIILTQTGASVGIAFGWNATTNETLAAGKTISIGAAGFNVGYLQIERFVQLGNVPMNLPLTGTASLTFGPTSAIGGNLTSTSASLNFNGCIFSGTVNSTKTGSTNDNSAGNNIFNDLTTITNSGSGYLLFGNGNADQFNAAATFNNTGSSNIQVAYNSANNIFNGLTTFNNSPSGNTLIAVSPNSAGTIFNENIVVTSTNGQGVQFGGGINASVRLVAGKTISIGSAGFSAGSLLLRQFTQTGPTSQNLVLTGIGNLTFGPASAFGGDVTTASPTLYFNGCNFAGIVTAAKNGATNDASSGNNIFNGSFSVTNTGAGYFMMGNGNPDIWQSTAVFNNLSTAQHMYIGYNSTGNTFNDDVLFNNRPGAAGLWIYPNYAGVNTQFNGNISVANLNGAGVYFGAGAGTAILATGKTISVGAGGFNSGGLIFRSFTQTGAGTAQALTTTGTSYIQYGANASFDGGITSSSPGLLFNGCTFNGTVNCTKTGTSNDQSQGNNIFNDVSTFVNNGTGYLLMTITSPDVYNGSTRFVQNSTGVIYPNYNGNSNYNGDLTITSPAATPITFGSNTGTASFSGTGGQSINVTGSTPAPVFTRLVINNTGSGVTLNNTSINVSNNLSLNSGLLNTTTSYLLTMLNGSTTATGNVLSTSYVNGPMRYKKSSSGPSTLNFPIGSGADCRPVSLTVNHTTGNAYTYQAQVFNASAVALGYSMPVTIDAVSGVHYYTISRMNAASVNQPSLELSGNQTIQVFFGSNDVVRNGGTLTIVKNTTAAPNSWIDIGSTGGPVFTGTNLSGSVTSTSTPSAFNSFSTFALADKLGGNNVLPISLLYFNAKPDNGQVDLNWATSTESNNDYFTIEKSGDGIVFEFVQNINTKALNGNSSTPLTYMAKDVKPDAGITYYRLKQTDLDGNFKYSAVVPVTFDKQKGLSVYPNPTSGHLYISGIDIRQTSIRLEWFDLSGRSLLQETASAQNGMAMANTRFNTGIYVLKITSADGTVKIQNIIITK
jgi:hypothetical protein